MNNVVIRWGSIDMFLMGGRDLKELVLYVVVSDASVAFGTRIA